MQFKYLETCNAFKNNSIQSKCCLFRDEFIDGILRNKFPSSRLEMNAVADKFDNSNGLIDWRKFMAALRPDWADRGPLTDAERIDDEINRQVD